MIRFLRSSTMILLLFGLLVFVENVQVTGSDVVDPKSLAALGFILLASFTLGEIFSTLQMPRVLGYIAAGFLFGPFTGAKIGLPGLEIFSSSVIKDIELVNNVALSLIAILAGVELKVKSLQKSATSILYILLIKVFLVFLIFPLAVAGVSWFFPFISVPGIYPILFTGMVLAVLGIATSTEISIAVINDTGSEGHFKDITLSLAILKDIIVIITFAAVMAIGEVLLLPSGGFNASVVYNLLSELLFSVAAGLAAAGLIILYLKFIGKETLLFVFSVIVFLSELSGILFLNTLVVFMVAGFVTGNFSAHSEMLARPLRKLSLPVFIVFFTVAGASIDFFNLGSIVLYAAFFSLLRIFIVMISVRTGGYFAKETNEVRKYGWTGLVSIGGLSLGLGMLIKDKIPGIGAELQSLITAMVAINLVIGPLLLKIGLRKAERLVRTGESPISEDIPKPVKASVSEKRIQTDYVRKFQEPDFNDEGLNNSLSKILIKLDSAILKFERKFIDYRIEESLEIVYGITEKYIDQYNTIRQFLTKPGHTAEDIKWGLLKAKEDITEWIISFIEEHKKIEQNILNLEPMVRELHFSLVDTTDGLQNEISVDLDESFFEVKPGSGRLTHFRKSFALSVFKLRKFLNKKYEPKRIIPYKNLAKYFLVGMSSGEILETVNLVGNERLRTLRQIQKLFEDNISYIDSLIKIADEERDNFALTSILLDKYEEIHKQFINEINVYQDEINKTNGDISTRLKYALANPFNKMLAVIKTAHTPEFKRGDYRYSSIYEKSEHEKELTLETIRLWIIYYSGFLGAFEKNAGKEKFRVLLNKIINSFIFEVLREINQKLELAVKEIKGINKEFKNRVLSVEDFLIKENIPQIRKFREQDFDKVLEKYNSSLDGIRRSSRLNSIIEILIEEFRQISMKMPEKILLLEESDLKIAERRPKYQALRRIPFREITSTLLEHKLPKELGELDEIVVNHLDIVIYELRNMSAVINFHINSAVKEIEEGNSISLDTAFELLDSMSDKIDYRIKQLDERILRVEKALITKIDEKLELAQNELNTAIRNKSMLRLGGIEDKNIVEKVSNIYFKAVTPAGRTLKYFYLTAKRFYTNNLRSFFTGWGSFLREKITGEELISAENVVWDSEKISNLPFIYRKLFDGTPVESTEFFVGTSLFIERIQDSLKKFYDDTHSSMLIVGEPGSGRRSMINAVRNNLLRDVQYFHYQFSDTITSREDILAIISNVLGFNRALSFEELQIELNDKAKKKIIVLEGIGKLFFRQINGYEAIKAFISLVTISSRNTFWICSISKHAWNFLDNNFDLKTIFGQVIHTTDFHAQDIRKIIRSRHNATGFDLEFIPDDLHKLKKSVLKIKSTDNEQKELEERFFDKLEEYSQGNIMSAMYYWLHSINTVKANKVIMNPPHRIQLGFISKLEDIYMLTISAILVHSWITDKEHSVLFNTTMDNSRKILNYLVSRNLLYRDELDVTSSKYFINKFVYKPIETELIKRNMN